MSNSTQPQGIRPQSSVSVATDRVSANITVLREAVLERRSRLEPGLLSPEPSPNTASVAADRNFSPLANTLEGLADNVEYISTIVDDIIKRVDL